MGSGKELFIITVWNDIRSVNSLWITMRKPPAIDKGKTHRFINAESAKRSGIYVDEDLAYTALL